MSHVRGFHLDGSCPLHHVAHQICNFHLVHAVTKTALEPIAIEQRQE